MNLLKMVSFTFYFFPRGKVLVNSSRSGSGSDLSGYYGSGSGGSGWVKSFGVDHDLDADPPHCLKLKKFIFNIVKSFSSNLI